MRLRIWQIVAFAASVVVVPAVVLAQTDETLAGVYASRPDLQAAFDPVTWQAVPDSAAGFLIDLEDWAGQYGWREYPGELAAYAPASVPPVPAAPSLLPAVTADAFIVLDRRSGAVLAEQGSGREWPIASITKLMTAALVLDSGTPLESVRPIISDDDVGGAKLYVSSGSTLSVGDLFYATLVGSANNAANALSRSSGLDKAAFVEAMNKKAEEFGLFKTHFTDPTGIEPSNVSTAREVAKLALSVFEKAEIGRYTSTAVRYVKVLSDGTSRRMLNTNWMLWRPEYDDVFVTSGKTGYLDESGWNLVVSLRPSADDSAREVLLVLFGSDSRSDVFRDARRLASWAWKNHQW